MQCLNVDMKCDIWYHDWDRDFTKLRKFSVIVWNYSRIEIESCYTYYKLHLFNFTIFFRCILLKIQKNI